MLDTPKTTQHANLIDLLLAQADAALTVNNYEKAIPLLVRIASLKEEQNASSADLADAYYDIGHACFQAAQRSDDKTKSDAHLLKSWHYLQLSITHYPHGQHDDITACNNLIKAIIKKNKHVAMRAIKAPKIQAPKDDIDLLAHSSDCLPESDEELNVDESFEDVKPKAKVKEKKKTKGKGQDNRSEHSSNDKTQYRAALINGELIHSIKLAQTSFTINLHAKWAEQAHLCGIIKMFNQIKKTRPLFRKHFKKVSRGTPLVFSIREPLNETTPKTILNFIREQAKREYSSSFLDKIREGELISHVEFDGEFAVFHVVEEYQSPEDLIKINTALYNRFINDSVLRENFGTPHKNDQMPKMAIKKPLDGLSGVQILEKFIAIINMKNNKQPALAKEKEERKVLLTPAAPVSERDADSENHLIPSFTPSEEPEYFPDDFISLLSEDGFRLQPTLTYQYPPPPQRNLSPSFSEENVDLPYTIWGKRCQN